MDEAKVMQVAIGSIALNHKALVDMIGAKYANVENLDEIEKEELAGARDFISSYQGVLAAIEVGMELGSFAMTLTDGDVGEEEAASFFNNRVADLSLAILMMLMGGRVSKTLDAHIKLVNRIADELDAMSGIPQILKAMGIELDDLLEQLRAESSDKAKSGGAEEKADVLDTLADALREKESEDD